MAHSSAGLTARRAIVREGVPRTGAQAGGWAERAPVWWLQGAQDKEPGAAKAGGHVAEGRRQQLGGWSTQHPQGDRD